jgi:hypothetical protein
MMRNKSLLISLQILILLISSIHILAQANPIIWDFESDLADWYQNPANNFVADRGVSVGADTDGRSALIMTVIYSGRAFEDAGASVVLNDGSTCRDLTQYTNFEIDFIMPAEFPVSDGKLWLKSGDSWYWAESEAIKIETNGDITWSVPLTDFTPLPDYPPIDLSCVQEVGFKIGTGTQYAGVFFVDEVRLLSTEAQTPESTATVTIPTEITTPVATTNPTHIVSSELRLLQWTFETSEEDWKQNPDNGFAADNGWAWDAGPDEQGALKVFVNYPGNTFEDAGVSVVLNDGDCTDLSQYTHYEVDFYFPSGFPAGSGGKLWLKYGEEWDWAESDFIRLELDEGALGSTLSWVVSRSRIEPFGDNPPIDWTCVHEVGLKIGSEAAYTGEFYINEVRLTQRPESIVVLPKDGIDRINIRSGPGQTFDPVGIITAGEKREAFFVNDTCTWVRIDLEEERWVALQTLTYEGVICELPIALAPR